MSNFFFLLNLNQNFNLYLSQYSAGASLLDWLILGAMLVFILGIGIGTRKHVKSVSDFLAAGRSAGRYLMAVSGAMAAIGAISIVSQFEMNLEAGFALAWWDVLTGIVLLIIAATGWVRYRFRQTRCLTLAEFFERRYSRRFRIFAGVVGFSAGLLNFGIFPAVGARFFIHFLGLPESFSVAGLEIQTYASAMFLLISIALVLVLAGGQVSVLITDFFQGAYANLIFIIVAAFLLYLVPWQHVGEVLMQAPAGHSKINPFDTGEVKTFNLAFTLIGVAGLIYNAMSWQGEQAYNASAESAHEVKMAQMLGMWREIPKQLLVVLVPVIVFATLQHSAYLPLQELVAQRISSIDNEAVKNQMTVPVALAYLLPTGLFGAFAAMMLAAFVSTHNTYLHSWASILVQDVVIPLRGKPLSTKAHIWLLRAAIVGVAVFIFIFSLWFEQVNEIMLYMALTGAIFAGWSGAVIIGGLYWKRGNAFGAWASGIIGVCWTLLMFICTQLQKALANEVEGVSVWSRALASSLPEGWGLWLAEHLPNGQTVWGLSMVICAFSYVIFSLLKPSSFSINSLLHRDEKEGKEEEKVIKKRSRLWHRIGITDRFTRGDALLYLLTYAWSAVRILLFVGITGFVLVRRALDGEWFAFGGFWLEYWHSILWLRVLAGILLVAWLTYGGIGDLRRMLQHLKSDKRDDNDDGFVANPKKQQK